ncbi:5'-AMP-activated protein kinase subunit beta-2 [Myotis lucifugus]|uniref:5'-AMP-activated protein kinase subunit beta-2 n=1 Tax=Myotis lucifugus TaxID=59463 RepID=UPI000CCC9305|nr:5'-AMP-activated protein kinase subunit beta-2 [Myotis lucifugus]
MAAKDHPQLLRRTCSPFLGLSGKQQPVFTLQQGPVELTAIIQLLVTQCSFEDDQEAVWKLPGDKEFVSWQQDLEDSVKPTQQARPTVIRWSEGGKEVFISGSFNNWSAKIPMIKSHNDFVAILDLPEGEHQYKFFVDGQWVHDPSEPVVTSQLGTINNLIHVKKSDFEVFDALKLDSMESSETSCRDLSSSPPGPYSQEMYVFRSEERFKSPPILPPHLLQVILNKDTNISCDPALLPEPNHVMLNHLYALSIKDSVMVLSATHRYKKK